MNKTNTFKSILIGTFLILGSVIANAADGNLSLSMVTGNRVSRLLLERTGDQITGTMNFARTPGISLKKTESGWQGWFGDRYVSSTSITSQSNTKYTIKITSLPTGYFRYTANVTGYGAGNSRTDSLEINGGANASTSLSSGRIRGNGREMTISSKGFSLGLNREGNGYYTGSVAFSRDGRFDSGRAELSSDGTLDPAIVARDTELYTLLFVFPFSN